MEQQGGAQLRGADAASSALPKAEKDRFSVDFALVATERKGLPVVRRIARGTVEAGFNCLA